MDLSHSPAFVGKREYREARKRQDARVQSESGDQNISKVNAAAEEESGLSGILKFKKRWQLCACIDLCYLDDLQVCELSN